jgi:GlpG protein
MRLIKTFEKETQAKCFSMFLQKQTIDNTLDVELDDATKIFSYSIWVHDEDKISLAEKYLEDFEKDPKDPKFEASMEELYPKEEPSEDVEEETLEEEIDETIEKKDKFFSFNITTFILVLCVFFYFLNSMQEKKIKEDNPNLSYVMLTPIQNILLFDMPYVLLKLDEVVKKYKIDPTIAISKQPVEVQKKLEEIDEMPFWRGFYEMILLKKDSSSESPMKGELFEKIRQGQVWRLFSPCVFHKDFLHLLFNMLWLWLLGNQIEQRLNRSKYIFLILIVGIISNISQYLMSGPYFLGYSGVIMGMVGFIWSRQKVAPWEGYPLQKSVFLFLGVYIFLMLGLSLVSFFTQMVGFNLLSPNIANTAHVSGVIVGLILGRIPFFSWSPCHER